ncbi:hypothetical protein ACOIDM_29060, partial [Klebsiella pneumoniae]|uniref:hypothetical protein n=1 Tax=Klebsiella pneumoniae TaxID=573 RepID=UPI003B5BE1C7
KSKWKKQDEPCSGIQDAKRCTLIHAQLDLNSLTGDRARKNEIPTLCDARGKLEGMRSPKPPGANTKSKCSRTSTANTFPPTALPWR